MADLGPLQFYLMHFMPYPDVVPDRPQAGQGWPTGGHFFDTAGVCGTLSMAPSCNALLTGPTRPTSPPHVPHLPAAQPGQGPR